MWRIGFDHSNHMINADRHATDFSLHFRTSKNERNRATWTETYVPTDKANFFRYKECDGHRGWQVNNILRSKRLGYPHYTFSVHAEGTQACFQYAPWHDPLNRMGRHVFLAEASQVS
jgi:hypothetical protein